MRAIFSSSWTIIVLVFLNIGANWYLNKLPEDEKASTKGKLLKGLMVIIVGLLVVSVAFTIIGMGGSG